MEMKISIFCLVAILATSISSAKVPDYSLYAAGEGTPLFAFQPSLRNPLRENSNVDEDAENGAHAKREIEDIQDEEEDSGTAVRIRREANPDENDRGNINVDVNRERGQGTRVDVTASGKVWESRDGNGRVDVHGNYGRTYGGPGGTGRPNYGGRITYSHRFKREANPDENDRGNVNVDVNRERGQGTRVDVTASGKVWESRDGNGRVDVHGNYGRTYGGPGGTGRPNYGGRITYSHRFRRSQQPRDDNSRDSGRGKDNSRGQIDVNVERQRGQGTRVDVTGTGKVWESRDGNGRVEVQGNYGRTYGGPGGTGRPNYGGEIRYIHRFRREAGEDDNAIEMNDEAEDIFEEDDDNSSREKREANPGDEQDNGRVDIDVNRERGQGTRVDASVSGKVWESRDGNGRVDVQGNYGRTYGGPQGTGRPDYGGRITYSHRFRREANPDENDRGNVNVDVNRERGQGTRVDVTASGKVWESRDGNGRVDVHGNYGRTYGGPGGTGRPNYGGRITYSHRFRRSLQPRDDNSRDSGRGKDDSRGNVDINVDRQRGQGTRVDVTGSGRVWESRDGNGRVDVHGNYGRTYGGPGGTGRPNYGGRITYSHRFRREANPDENDRGNVNVDVNRERGQGTRVDVTASGKVWESRDGNGRVDVQGNYGRTYGGPGGTGRPNYGGRITYSHRF